MTYIPNTDSERQAMLQAVGVSAADDLFNDISEEYRFPELRLPPALAELEILRELEELAGQNEDLRHRACFLGAGAYHHFIPSVVNYLLHRSEFVTAYTPYQPEISQGTLQAHYEFQTMISGLTGMEAANVSHYDGATAAAEAVIMAMNVSRGKRHHAVLSPTLHPQYREVVRTYTQGMGETLAGDDLPPGDLDALAAMITEETACLIVQNPDFLGKLYTPTEMQALADSTHEQGALFVVTANPISLGLFQPPAAYGADIVIGEGQPLGNPLSFGGPYLGFFATKMQYVHKTAGRIVGMTRDADGNDGFVLTLSSREQHIRRERASSNICSNQALNALAAAIYLSVMGKHGLKKVAELCYHKAHYAADRINALQGYHVNDTDFFNEFVVACPRPVADIIRTLTQRYGIIGGYDLESDYPSLAGHMLLCVTEMNSRQEIDRLATALEEIAHG